MSDEILAVDVPEAARRLGMKRSAVYVLIKSGDLASITIRGARRVAVVDLIDFVEMRRRASVPPNRPRADIAARRGFQQEADMYHGPDPDQPQPPADEGGDGEQTTDTGNDDGGEPSGD